MKFTDNKLEIAIAGLAIAMMGGLGYFINGIKDKTPTEVFNMVYSMPRPKSYSAAGFDLNGREVERQYVNPFAKKDQKVKKTNELVKGIPTPTPATEAAKENKKTAAKKTKKKGQMSVEVVDKDQNSGFQDDSGLAMTPQGSGVNSNYAGAKPVDNKAETKISETEKLSGNQWRSLLAADPSQKNVSLLVAAFLRGEVEEASFYVVVNDLLSNSKNEVQQLGVWAAASTPSARSFVLLANQMDSLSEGAAKQAEAALAEYAQGSRQGAILRVLASNESEAVVRAIEIVVKGYQTSQTEQGGGRGDRGDVKEQALASYVRYIPALNALQGNADARIVEAASQALGLLSIAAN